MRVVLCILSALLVAGCSTIKPQVGPATLPATNASVAEVQSYEARKEASAKSADYPAWTYPAGVAAKVAQFGAQFAH